MGNSVTKASLQGEFRVHCEARWEGALGNPGSLWGTLIPLRSEMRGEMGGSLGEPWEPWGALIPLRSEMRGEMGGSLGEPWEPWGALIPLRSEMRGEMGGSLGRPLGLNNSSPVHDHIGSFYVPPLLQLISDLLALSCWLE